MLITNPAVEDLNTVVIRVSYNQVVVFSDADLAGIVKFSLLFSFSSDSLYKLALREVNIMIKVASYGSDNFMY